MSPDTPTPPRVPDITGLVLAGGRGSRMGGTDKGLQGFNGVPLALHALLRLQLQTGGAMINANRHLAAYESFGVPVWPDALPDFAGPLAGFRAGLEQCETEWLLTVPCDCPRFPLDLAERMAQAVAATPGALCGVAVGLDTESTSADGAPAQLRDQPVFCLLHISTLQALHEFIQGGGRKIDRWTATLPHVRAVFDRPTDDPLAFANANTLEDLRRLQALPPHG